MKCASIAAGLLCLAGIAHAENPPGIPPEYKLLYSQDFAKPEATKDFQFSDPGAWEIKPGDGKAALELTRQSSYKPAFRSPFNIALLADKI